MCPFKYVHIFYSLLLRMIKLTMVIIKNDTNRIKDRLALKLNLKTPNLESFYVFSSKHVSHLTPLKAKPQTRM